MMDKKVRWNESLAMLDKRRAGILKKMAHTGPFIMATPAYVKIRCGNPNCKCAKNKGARHTKLHLTWSDSEGSGTQYVPVDLRKEVLEWVENYWIVKEYMKDMTNLSRGIIRVYARSRKKLHKRKT